MLKIRCKTYVNESKMFLLFKNIYYTIIVYLRYTMSVYTKFYNCENYLFLIKYIYGFDTQNKPNIIPRI